MIVEKIVWEDPASIDSWTDIKELDGFLNHIITVGIILNETATSMIVCLNYDPKDQQASCTMYIPKSTIISREIICKI